MSKKKIVDLEISADNNSEMVTKCDHLVPVDYSNFPLGHSEKSVIILLRLGLDLTDAEIAAIRWHMTAWNLPFQIREALGNINAAKDKYPLCALVQLADGFASSLMEDTV